MRPVCRHSTLLKRNQHRSSTCSGSSASRTIEGAAHFERAHPSEQRPDTACQHPASGMAAPLRGPSHKFARGLSLPLFLTHALPLPFRNRPIRNRPIRNRPIRNRPRFRVPSHTRGPRSLLNARVLASTSPGPPAICSSFQLASHLVTPRFISLCISFHLVLFLNSSRFVSRFVPKCFPIFSLSFFGKSKRPRNRKLAPVFQTSGVDPGARGRGGETGVGGRPS